jgi:RimJ/RimL family protein N-acetyltransferase
MAASKRKRGEERQNDIGALDFQRNWAAPESQILAATTANLVVTSSCANPFTGATVINGTPFESILGSLRAARAMSLPHEIHTPRLLLRPPSEADAELMFARYSCDLEVCRYMSWRPHRSIDDTIAYLRKKTTDAGLGEVTRRLIFCRTSGVLLGSIGGQFDNYRFQFGYCLARDAWGEGFATEAARAFVAAAMSDPNIWRVQAYCDVENRASARVLEKTGLSYEGTLKRYLIMPNLSDEPRDMLCYAKVRENGRQAIS